MQRMRDEGHRPRYTDMDPRFPEGAAKVSRFLEGAAKILKDQEERVKNSKPGDKEQKLSNIILISKEAQEAQKAKKS